METFGEIRVATEEILQDVKNIEFALVRMIQEDQLRCDSIEKDEDLKNSDKSAKEMKGRQALISFGNNMLGSVRKGLEGLNSFHGNFKSLPDEKQAPLRASQIADEFLEQNEEKIEVSKLAYQAMVSYREDLLNGKYVPARVEDYSVSIESILPDRVTFNP